MSENITKCDAAHIKIGTQPLQPNHASQLERVAPTPTTARSPGSPRTSPSAVPQRSGAFFDHARGLKAGNAAPSAQADPIDTRQFDREIKGIEAEGEAEKMEFDPLDATERKARKPQKG